MTSLGGLIAPFYPRYKASRFARSFKVRRYRKIIDCLGLSPPASILDVGCGTGADFTRFAIEDGYRCHGLDISRQEHLSNFEFTEGNACKLPFPDKHFDAAVSVGVFEHIQPIEDLCLAAREISRVAKRYLVLVPSIGTLLEPHTMAPLWNVRDHNTKWRCGYALNFLSDEAWLQMNGFIDGRTQRLWYLPFIQNLMIYGGRD